MKIAKKDLIEAISAVKGFCASVKSLPICAKVLIDGPGQKLVATDLNSRAEFSLKIEDFKATIMVENPVPAIGEDFMKLLGSQKAPDLKDLVAGDLFPEDSPARAAIKKDERAKLIYELCEEDPDLYVKVLAALGEEYKDQEVEVPEQFLVDPDLLLKIVKSEASSDVIVLQAEEYTVPAEILDGEVKASALKVGDHFQRVPLEHERDFPGWEELKMTAAMKLTGKQLGWVASAKLPANDDKNTGFKSIIFFDSENDNVVTCDGSRLHILSGKVAAAENLFLERGPLGRVAVLAKEKDITVGVDAACEQAVLEIGSLKVFTHNDKTIQFPDYLKLSATQFVHEIEVDNETIENVCKQVALISNGADFTFNGSINAEAASEESGECRRLNVPVKKGEVTPEVQVRLNPSFLMDALKGLAKKVTISLSDANTIVGFMSGDQRALIMPMRV